MPFADRTKLFESLATEQWSAVLEHIQGGGPIDWVADDGRTIAHIASMSGCLEVLEALSARSFTVDCRDKTGVTPFMMAVNCNHLECASFLLENGANIHAAEKDDHQAVHFAAQLGLSSMIEFLADNGADIESTTKHLARPIHLACLEGHTDVASYLINDVKVDVNAQIRSGKTPLMYAVVHGHVSIINLLLQSGRCDIELTDRDQWTAMHFAAQRNRPEAVTLLVSSGAVVAPKARGGAAPMHVAAQHNNVPVLQTLADAGHPVSAKDEDLWEPLFVAASQDSMECVRALVNLGASINAQTDKKRCALHAASQNGLDHIVTFLLERGADINAVDVDGWNALFFAVLEGRLTVAELLIENGIDICHKDCQGLSALDYSIRKQKGAKMISLLRRRTAQASSLPQQSSGPELIHISALEGRISSVREELDRGVHPGLSTPQGASPLMCASQNGHLEICRLLLRFGGSRLTSAADENGMTAAHFACMNDHSETLKFLLTEGEGSSNVVDNVGRSLAIICCQAKALQCLQVLVSLKANVDIPFSETKVTSLHMCCEAGVIEFVEVLIEGGASTTYIDTDNWCALHYAAQNGHTNVCKVLLENGSLLCPISTDSLTPLFLAANAGHIETCQFLCERGAGITRPDMKLTDLHRACLGTNVGAVEMLLDVGLDLHAQTTTLLTPLHTAAEGGCTEIINFLLSRGADINAREIEDWVPAAFAASKNNPDALQLLLSKGTDIKTRTGKGSTFLHLAAQHGSNECLIFLLEAGLSPHLECNNQSIPLHRACQDGHLMAARLLIDLGSDVLHTDRLDETPLVDAVNAGNPELVQLLQHCVSFAIQFRANPEMDVSSAIVAGVPPSIVLREALLAQQNEAATVALQHFDLNVAKLLAHFLGGDALNLFNTIQSQLSPSCHAN